MGWKVVGGECTTKTSSLIYESTNFTRKPVELIFCREKPSGNVFDENEAREFQASFVYILRIFMECFLILVSRGSNTKIWNYNEFLEELILEIGTKTYYEIRFLKISTESRTYER